MLKAGKQYTAEQVIVDIIAKEMELSAQSVWVRNQNKKIPNDNGLYVVAGMVDGTQVISVTDSLTFDNDGNPIENQKIILRENIQIDIFSRSDSARLRRYEILQSLASIYSVQQQEKYTFKIFKMPATFVNSSDAEGGSNLNRFTVIVAVHTWNLKTKLLSSSGGDYYDNFSTRVDDEVSIGTENGIIEFNITEN